MKIDDGRSIGNPATSIEVDELLRSRMKILGLDVEAIGRDFREVFEEPMKGSRLRRNGDDLGGAARLSHRGHRLANAAENLASDGGRLTIFTRSGFDHRNQRAREAP
jgi:hypothetical protein